MVDHKIRERSRNKKVTDQIAAALAQQSENQTEIRLAYGTLAKDQPAQKPLLNSSPPLPSTYSRNAAK